MTDIYELFWNYVPAQQIRNERDVQDLETLRTKLYGAACSLLEYDCVSTITATPSELVDAFLRKPA